MVAGWDNLLPQWFVRLHPRHRTPVNSILFVGGVTLAVAMAVVIGVGEQEAFQLLNNASGIFYALTYLVMFALPIAGFRGRRQPPPLWLKLAALSGFLMTALYVILSVFPIVPVDNAAPVHDQDHAGGGRDQRRRCDAVRRGAAPPARSGAAARWRQLILTTAPLDPWRLQRAHHCGSP